MAVPREDFVDIELNNGTIFRSFMNMAIGGGDNSANIFGVRMIKNGEPADTTGLACVGYFIRPDGNTLVINGSISGNMAYVTLPAAAFVVEGNYSLVIKVSGTGFTETLRIVDGTVVKTTTETILDPASVVPSLEDLLEVIERAENAADEINSISVSAEQIAGTRYKIAVTITT